jgi:hypothetical protein
MAEVTALRAVIGEGAANGRVLGEANGKLQRVAYFRRVPSHPAREALQAELRRSAERAGLRVERLAIDDDPRGTAEQEAPLLRPGERWRVDRGRLIGRLPLQIVLRGAPAAIAAWIDALPTAIERLVLLRQASRVGEAVALQGEAFFERALPAPKVGLDWPPLAEWLRAAGHAPEGASVRAAPGFAALEQAVRIGRELTPDARLVLLSAADLPRWPARAAALAELSAAVAAVKGPALLAALGAAP